MLSRAQQGRCLSVCRSSCGKITDLHKIARDLSDGRSHIWSNMYNLGQGRPEFGRSPPQLVVVVPNLVNTLQSWPHTLAEVGRERLIVGRRFPQLVKTPPQFPPKRTQLWSRTLVETRVDLTGFTPDSVGKGSTCGRTNPRNKPGQAASTLGLCRRRLRRAVNARTKWGGEGGSTAERGWVASMARIGPRNPDVAEHCRFRLCSVRLGRNLCPQTDPASDGRQHRAL